MCVCVCTHKKTHKSSLETEELRLTGEAECAALRLAMNQSCWVGGRYIMKYECVIKCVCMSPACGITLMFTFTSCSVCDACIS